MSAVTAAHVARPAASGITTTLGVSAAAFAIGAAAGWVSTPDDASQGSYTRYGLKSRTEASSREAALAKIEQQRASAKQSMVIGGVVFGAGMVLPGTWRLGPAIAGAALAGGGAASLLTLRNGEENVAHLPSREEVLASRLAPLATPLPASRVPAGGLTTVAEQFGIGS